MAEITDVDIVAGVPTTGTGTVPTLSKTNTVIGSVIETAPASDTASSGLNGRLQRIAQRVTSLITLHGAATDAKSTATDATSVTFMQVFKQISASVQSLVTAIGSTAWDLGIGTSGTRTQRMSIDTAQLAPNRTTAGAMTDGYQLVDTPTDGTNATRLGGLTETAPASDTASSGLNGRLQRIAQNVTTLIAATLKAAGPIAHDAADSTAPVKGGHKATTSLAGRTLVADADVTDSFAGIDGAQIVRPHCNLEDIVSGVAAITDGSSTSVIASAGAGVKNYITSAIFSNSSATAVTVDLRDGAAGSVKATFPVPANVSGAICNLPVPLPFSAATAVCADPSAAATTVTVTLIGFKSKV